MSRERAPADYCLLGVTRACIFPVLTATPSPRILTTSERALCFLHYKQNHSPLSSLEMDAFFVIAAPVPEEIESSEAEIFADKENIGTNGIHGGCVIA
ncbi:hypothetical protein C2E23DRAFT_882359 [Lenzites betulinus]|nr:hypothetical protein C2E23DRAFT_882359 [Lenzites betulinus]